MFFGVELREGGRETEGFLVWNGGMCGTEGFLVLNRGVFGMELRRFRRRTEGCVELRSFGVELRILRAEKEWPFCVELMC